MSWHNYELRPAPQSAGLERRVGRLSGFPVKSQFLMRSGAISQIKIDERLVGDADLLREFLKVADSAFVHPESYLTFESAGVRVFYCF